MPRVARGSLVLATRSLSALFSFLLRFRVCGAGVLESWIRVNWMRDRLHSSALTSSAVVLLLLDCCRSANGTPPVEPPLLKGEGCVRPISLKRVTVRWAHSHLDHSFPE